MSEEENLKHQEERFSTDCVSAEALKNPIQRERIDKAVALIGGPGLKVLDIGCSDGSLSELIHNNGNECWGMDLSAVIARVPEKYKAWFHPFSGDAGKKPWGPSALFPEELGTVFGQKNAASEYVPYVPDGFFDVVFAGEIIEHFFDIEPFFSEAHRVLKPGGRLVMTTPNSTRAINRIGMLFGDISLWHEWERIPHHVRYWTPFTLRDALLKYGFRAKRWESGMSQAEGLGGEFGFDETWWQPFSPGERVVLTGLFRRVMPESEPILRHSFIIVEAEKKE